MKLNELEAAEDPEFDENLDQHARRFRDMLQRLELGRQMSLSLKQRQYLSGVYERVVGEPTYLNLASSGNLCRGREVETPALLRRENLPLSPPKRRPPDDL